MLVLGDVCWDTRIIVSAIKENPENKSTPVFKVCSWTESSSVRGMAANVANNLKHQKIYVTEFFPPEESWCQKERYIKLNPLDYSEETLFRLDEDKVAAKAITPVYLFDYVDAIVVSDYNKGFITKEVLVEVVEYAKYRNIPVFIDTKCTDLVGLEYAFIKINEPEAAAISAYPNNTDRIIVTKGARGCVIGDKSYPAIQYSGTGGIDVCGAGDSFLAGLVVGYLKFEKDLDKAIKWATCCAHIAVGHYGTYAPRLDDIKNLYETIYDKNVR